MDKEGFLKEYEYYIKMKISSRLYDLQLWHDDIFSDVCLRLINNFDKLEKIHAKGVSLKGYIIETIESCIIDLMRKLGLYSRIEHHEINQNELDWENLNKFFSASNLNNNQSAKLLKTLMEDHCFGGKNINDLLRAINEETNPSVL